MRNRRKARFGLKVIHRHRVGNDTLRRVSELVFVHGEAKAVLDWVDMAGDRTPVYVDLDRSRLHAAKDVRKTFYYDGITVDPRSDDLSPPLPLQRQRI
jgi:hypothetical protein